MTALHLDLADIVVCPDCAGPLELLELAAGRGGLICHDCVLVHPIDDGIFILLLKDARSPEIEGPLRVHR